MSKRMTFKEKLIVLLMLANGVWRFVIYTVLLALLLSFIVIMIFLPHTLAVKMEDNSFYLLYAATFTFFGWAFHRERNG